MRSAIKRAASTARVLYYGETLRSHDEGERHAISAARKGATALQDGERDYYVENWYGVAYTDSTDGGRAHDAYCDAADAIETRMLARSRARRRGWFRGTR